MASPFLILVRKFFFFLHIHSPFPKLATFCQAQKRDTWSQAHILPVQGYIHCRQLQTQIPFYIPFIKKDVIYRYSLPKSSWHCMFHTIDVRISWFTIRIYKKNGSKEYLSATLLIQKSTENCYWLTYTWTFGWLVTPLMIKMNNE